jgi:hypothetical protein
MAAADQHFHEAMPTPCEIGAYVFAAAAQIADRFLLGGRRRDDREQASAMQLDEFARVSPVRLYPLARFSRDQRRSHDLADNLAGGFEAALERVSTRARLVANADLATARVALEPASQLPNRPLVVVDL